MAITIKDIAKKADKSVSTVSKALNNRSDISENLKFKIRILAKEMGYKKNIIASRLVNKKSNTIGVFVFSRNSAKRESETTATKYIKTLLDETKNRGYDLVLFSIDSDSQNSKSYYDLCTERQVEGAILIGFKHGDPLMDEMTNSNLPIVMIERTAIGEKVSSITFDNEYGVKSALDYLLSLKHSKIAFIKGKSTATTHNRFTIYKEYMKSRNLYREDFIYQGDYTLESGYNIGCNIVKSRNPPTAILSSSDLMAIGILRAFQDNNIKVPQDISIIGYDNFEISKYVIPRLTTVAQDFYLVAIQSIEVILDMIHNNTEPKSIILKPELLRRESCSQNLRKVYY